MFPIWVNDGKSEVPRDDIFYIIAKQGIFLKKSLGHFDTISKVNSISILGDCESHAVLNVAKIKARQFAQILTFFRGVYDKYKSEVNLILHYNIKRKRYRIDIPPQGVTGASVQYENGLETYKDYIRIGTIHSHANMTAFHSGTDQGDEESWDGIHITLGKMGEDYFDISCSLMSGKERFMVDPTDYIEGVQLIEYTPETSYPTFRYVAGIREEVEPQPKLGWDMIAEEKDFSYPSKWMDKIDKYKPKPKHNVFNYANFGRSFGGHDFNGVSDFYQRFSSNLPQANQHNSIFNSGFTVDPGEWSPCGQCPYKEHKSAIIMKELIKRLDIADRELLLDNLTEEEIAILGDDPDIFPADYNFEDMTEDDLIIHGQSYDPENDPSSPFYVDDKEGNSNK